MNLKKWPRTKGSNTIDRRNKINNLDTRTNSTGKATRIERIHLIRKWLYVYSKQNERTIKR